MIGRIFVISGPSGAGKSTIIRDIRKRVDRLGYSVSHTSRRPRGVETDGVEYHFVDPDAFRAMIARNEFAEWAEVFGDYYGTSFSELENKTSRGLDVIMDLDVQGAASMRRAVKSCILVFVLPPSMEVLERRLRGRGTDDPAAVARRIERASAEIRRAPHYDYLVVNDRLTEAVEEMASIIRADRCRTRRRLHQLRTGFDFGEKRAPKEQAGETP
ncbi:MAG: guanylate kinase [Deltaproteobacteria bacterium]|nr:guanylate kinase [Deltaproteobacteria bacterium]